MTLPKPDRLQDLSRDELIALILPLIERVRQLEAEVAALKSKTPLTSQNSSLPPARDWKADAATGKKRLTDLCGTSLSEGGEVSVLERAGAAAQPLAEAIGVQVRGSRVIQSDETNCRVHGRNWWEWVFVSDAGEYHLIRQSRG